MSNSQILSESGGYGTNSNKVNMRSKGKRLYETRSKQTNIFRVFKKLLTKSPINNNSTHSPNLSVKRVLELWSKLSTNLRMRDRIVKVIQYGCQMILGYYSYLLSDYMKTGIAETRRFGSNARKAFWLLKSFNHLNSMIKMYEDRVLLTGHIADKFDFFEQLFLAIYFLTENFVFFIRSKILPIREDDIDYWVNLSWFGADLMAFISACLRSYDNYSTVWKLTNLMPQCNCCEEERFGMNVNASLCKCGQQCDLCHVDEFSGICRIDEVEGKILKLEQQQGALALTWLINLFELGVSAQYVGGFKAILGRDMCDGHVGLMGVISSSLILYEGLLGILKEMHPKADGEVTGNESQDSPKLHVFEIDNVGANEQDESKDDKYVDEDGGTEATTRSCKSCSGSSKRRSGSSECSTGSHSSP